MADVTSSSKTPIEIPQSIVEYTASFAEPVIQLGDPRAATTMTILRALKPWGFTLAGLETRLRSEKANDHAFVFKRTNPARPAHSFALFYDKVFVSAENLDWESAETTVSAMSAGIDAVKQSTNASIAAQQLVAGIHIQLKGKTALEVMKPLLSSSAVGLLAENLKFPGVIVTGETSNVIIEASVVYANALWVRLYRDHKADVTLQQMAAALRQDEERLFDVLDLEGPL